MSKSHYLKDELYKLIKNDDTIFDFIQRASLDGLWYWDLEHPEHEWMNAKFWTTLGYDPADMPHLADAWQDIINPDDLQETLENFRKHIADPHHPYDQLVRYRHKDGSTVWIRCRGLAIRDENGTPIRMLGAHNDITELKEAEQRTTEETTLYKTFHENQSTYLIKLDREGNYTYINDFYCDDFGWSREDLMGQSSLIGVPEEDHQHALEVGLACYAEPGKHFKARLRKQLKGSIKVTDWEFTAVTNAQGEPELICIGVDVTKQVEAETDLQRTKRLLEDAGRIANMGGWEFDLSTGHGIFTDQVYAIHELSVGTSIDSKTALAFYHPDDQPVISEAVNRAVKQQEPYDLQCRFFTAKGHHRWVRTSGQPVVEDGNVTHLIGMLQDITAQKEVELARQTTLTMLEQSHNQNIMLLKEIHHRVKNNLAVISALLALRASDLKDPVAKSALQESRDRIKAMAEVHELMYHHDSNERIAFEKYLSGFVDRMKRSFAYGKQPITFALEVAQCDISLDQAVPLGLIINELLTNAVKHAFANDHPDPRITVTATADNGLTLTVTDNGVGVDDTTNLETSESLGMTVINSLTEQLEGNVTFANRSSNDVGLQVTLRVPLV